MVHIEQISIPALSGETPRRLFVYVPDEDLDMEEDAAAEEGEEEEIRYPVLYMFDGHNVFFDQTATYGKSWGMKEYLEKAGVPLIVVAIECNHEGLRRLEEYSPYRGTVAGDPIRKAEGRITMDWITEWLKPVIDDMFPTIPDREHTAVAGSSMGGLMALYAGTVYNRVFTKAACLSPSIGIDFPALTEDIRGSEIGPDTRIYMDLGSEELAWFRDGYRYLENIEDILAEKGAFPCLRLIAGGTHSEASWERQIPVFLRHLGLEE